MNRTTLFKSTTILLCLISMGAFGQGQSKTYNETFNVGEETVLEINTSHADIEFETWDKNEVVIEATIELTDVSEEDAETYFENGGIEILGNSKKITISTGAENTWLFRHSVGGLNNFHFEMPEVGPVIVDMPEMEELHEIITAEAMPPLPPQHFHPFDHEAYKKDGEKYMKKWQKEFTKGFDKEYEKKIEEWGKRMEERAERMEKRRKQMKVRAEARSEHLFERAKERAERQKESEEKRRVMLLERSEMRKNSDSPHSLFIQNDSINFGGPNIFYFNSDGHEGNIKIKKTIKIKMPKSVKLKMNVRHGEVKLAENTKNLKATLSHARLLATNIDGDDTAIIASYSPVSVLQWNYGQLQADYSENVELREVHNLTLKSTSSDITIDRLLTNLTANSSFGPIRINEISKDFKDLDVSLQNAELIFELPKTSFNIYVNGTSSKLSTPLALSLNKTKNHNSVINKGYHLKNNSGRSIIINSKYSEVIME